VKPDSANDELCQVFLEVVDLDQAQRAAVYSARKLAPETRQAVEELVVANQRTSLLDREPALRFSAQPPIERIASYEVLSTQGSGSMGVVYRARQSNPVREVALKVIRPELRDDEILRRFERESRALARLQHPGIAQVFEAGTADTPIGRLPFFAMEFVDGAAIDDYARDLGVSEIVTLMIRVCDAVAHAHERGVVHRDLKPGNILVDARGQPRVLDFGIARLAGDGDDLQTKTGMVVGTLAYMSPEQVNPAFGNVDDRTDVYALGVILYQLITGRRPLELGELSMVQAATAICERDPLPLTALVSGTARDLETVVLRALAKDKKRRYSSASALREDLERFAADRPVLARPPSALYQLSKFSRRHRGLVAGLALAFGVLLVGITATSVALLRARSAERRIEVSLAQLEKEHDKLQAVKQLLETILASPHPAEEGRNVRVRDALDRALQRSDVVAQLDEQPEIAGLLLGTVGSIYHELGMFQEARRFRSEALAKVQSVFGEQSAEVIDARGELALTLSRMGAFEAARTQFDLVISSYLGEYGERHPKTIEAQVNNAGLRFRSGERGPQFESELLELAERCRLVLGEQARSTLTVRNTAASVQFDAGDVEAAIEEFERLVPQLQQVRGPRDVATLTTMNNLAQAYMTVGKIDAADALAGDVLAKREAVLGPDHIDVGSTKGILGEIRRQQGRLAEAREYFSESVRIVEAAVGQEDARYAAAINSLATVVAALDGPDAAEPLLRDNLVLVEGLRGSEHPDTLMAFYGICLNLEKQGQPAQAEELYRDLLERAERSLQANDWRLAAFRLGAARALIQTDQGARAWPLLDAAYAVFIDTFGADHEYTQIVRDLQALQHD